MTQCKQCKKEFEITDQDREFYTKIDVPEPDFCHECRQQRRLAWRNERSLYARKCAHTGADMISIYSPDAPWPVFSSDAWYGDTWDQLATGREFDFSRPFFEQFKELQAVAPHLGLMSVNNENSPYVNMVWHSKNCYMCFDIGYAENCYYCTATYNTRDSVDNAFTTESELSYECIGSTKCFHSIFLEDCLGCNDAAFSYDCRNCSDIILCSNLRNKQYCILNRQYTKEEYEQEKKKYDFHSFARFEEIKEKFFEMKQKAIHRFSHNKKCEECSGDYVSNSRNMKHCFDCEKSENCIYVTRVESDVKDTMDVDHAAEGELMYEGVAMAGFNIKFGFVVARCQDVEYSEVMINCNNCFGCAHLHNQEFCILNKKYSKEEYVVMREKIIAHMKKTGEWGLFFPPALAPYGYNEAIVNDFHPTTRDEALARGFHWRDQKAFATGKETVSASALPDKLVDGDSEFITKNVLACVMCGRNYKCIKQELDLYQKIGVPIPRECFECRNNRRFCSRNPRKLWHRQCMCEKGDHEHAGQCAEQFETSYTPERPEIVYCEHCYQKEVI